METEIPFMPEAPKTTLLLLVISLLQNQYSNIICRGNVDQKFTKKVVCKTSSSIGRKGIPACSKKYLPEYLQGHSGLEIKILSREPNCIFSSYLEILCIETSTSLGSLEKFEGAAGEFNGALGFRHPLILSPDISSRMYISLVKAFTIYQINADYKC